MRNDGAIFAHDFAAFRTAIIVKICLEELVGVSTLVWPPYRPDLNPMENLRSCLEERMYGEART